MQSKHQASQIHHQVEPKVRQTIRELGGTMPENLPVAESIKKPGESRSVRIESPAAAPDVSVTADGWNVKPVKL